MFGRKFTKYTVIHGVYIRSWPTLHMYSTAVTAVTRHSFGPLLVKGSTHMGDTHTHTHVLLQGSYRFVFDHTLTCSDTSLLWSSAGQRHHMHGSYAHTCLHTVLNLITHSPAATCHSFGPAGQGLHTHGRNKHTHTSFPLSRITPFCI